MTEYISKGIACPACRSRASQRSMRTVTPTYRQLYFVCSDLECGCTFGGVLEVTHIISPSAIENPAMKLPYRPSLRRRPGSPPIPANDDHEQAAAVAH